MKNWYKKKIKDPISRTNLRNINITQIKLDVDEKEQIKLKNRTYLKNTEQIFMKGKNK